MKNRKVRVLFMLSAFFALWMSVSALASATQPYSTYFTAIYGTGTNLAEAYIGKCNCNPVGNYLYAGIRVQYSVSGQYIWDPVSQYLNYYSEGYDVRERKAVVEHDNINYAKGTFKARCTISGGSLYVFYREQYK